MAQKVKKKYIENNAIDGEKIKLLKDQSVRAADSSGSEINLISLSPSDAVLVKDQEVALKTDITAEAIIRQAADNSLQEQINNISSNIDPVALDSLTEIVAAFQAADYDLNSAISSMGTGSQSNLSNEITNRQVADAALQANIDSESSARESADNLLQAAIDAERDRAVAAETSIQLSISDEISDRQDADQALQNQIDSEVSARQQADEILQNQINNILSNIDPAALDSLTEIVAAFQAADYDFNQAINNLSSRISTVESVTWASHKISVDSSILQNNFIDLPHLAVEGSLIVSIDRLMVHEGQDEDFVVSTENGKTRITFINGFVSGGYLNIDVGDNFYIRYQHKV